MISNKYRFNFMKKNKEVKVHLFTGRFGAIESDHVCPECGNPVENFYDEHYCKYCNIFLE